MFDPRQIGKRIRDQRKYLLHVTQEQMALDLGMSQGDVSRMENGKRGVGLDNLEKLDFIAEYLRIPLETLVFGGEISVEKYCGDTMRLRQSSKAITPAQEAALHVMSGLDPDDPIVPASYECGPYAICVCTETLSTFGGPGRPRASMPRFHLCVFLGDDLVAVAVADRTPMIAHVNFQMAEVLHHLIHDDIIGTYEVVRTLNPYRPLWELSGEADERDPELEKLMLGRMTSLNGLGPMRDIIYLESVYVRPDCRQRGILRMLVDLIKELFEGCAIWANLEPVGEDVLEGEASFVPFYEPGELGQLGTNAVIAERLGFTIDPLTVPRRCEVVGVDGRTEMGVSQVRKIAYWLPAELRELLADDGNLVEKGRAIERALYDGDDGGGQGAIFDFFL